MYPNDEDRIKAKLTEALAYSQKIAHTLLMLWSEYYIEHGETIHHTVHALSGQLVVLGARLAEIHDLTAPAPPAATESAWTKEPYWQCPNCGGLNCAVRQACRLCKTPKPEHRWAIEPDTPNVWSCSACGRKLPREDPRRRPAAPEEPK